MLLNELEAFMDGLYELGCVKFGEFILSSGLRTPVYFDLRILISCPRLLQQAALLFQKYMIEHNLEYDVICGVPYGACGLATVFIKQFLFSFHFFKGSAYVNLINFVTK
jgi:orotate phosphoribosyltransferase